MPFWKKSDDPWDRRPGRPPAAPEEPERAHVGIENVRGRLAALCGGRLDIQSTAGVGTTAAIIIPKEDGT